MMRFALALVLSLLSTAAFAQSPTTYTLANGVGQTYTFRAFSCSGLYCTASVPMDASGNPLTATAGGAAPNSGMMVGGIYNASAPSPSNGQFEPFQLDSAGRLVVNCGTGCSSGGGGNVNLTQILGAAPSATNPLWMSPATGAVFPVSQAAASSLNATVVGTGTFAVQATQSGTWTVNPTTISTWGLGSVAPGTAPTNMQVAGAIYNASPVSPSSGQTFALQADANGYLEVNIKAGAGSGGTALADEASFTSGTTSLTPIGGVYNFSITNLSSGQAGAVALTAARSMHVLDDNSAAILTTLASINTNIQAPLPLVYQANYGSACNYTSGNNAWCGDGGGAAYVDLGSINGNAIVTGGIAGSQGVGGLVAAGGAITGINPVMMGGSDGTDVRALSTDTSGHAIVEPGNTANTTPWLASISAGGNTAAVKAASTAPATTDPAVVVTRSPASPYHLITVATNNATVVKNAPGVLYDITITQTTTTLGDLRLYDTASTPTCSSATGVVGNFAVLSNATSPGFHLPFPSGKAFVNGISFCFTGAVADNDNTSFVAGVPLDMSYK